MKITLIHLSDIHMRVKTDNPDNRHAAKLVTHLRTTYGQLPKQKTFVIVTGDIVHSTRIKQFERCRDDFLTPLQERFNVLVAPGNHDYAKVGLYFDKEGPARFQEYIEHVEFKSDRPAVRDIPAREPKIRLIGLDTGDKKNKVYLANGILTKEQREALGSVLASSANTFNVIYLHHHPFHRTEMTGFKHCEKFLDLIQGKANIVLFGHKHKNEAFFGRYDVPLMLASGKVTKPNREGYLAYRVLTLDTLAAGFGKGLNGVTVLDRSFPKA